MNSKAAIVVFAHTRPEHLRALLNSLARQNALDRVHIWMDGHQNYPDVRDKVLAVRKVADAYAVASLTAYNGLLGFRKLLLHALDKMSQHHERLIILEDDCFPNRDAIAVFDSDLEAIKNESHIFSVYGHHFLMPAEGDTIGRFQGWGWAAYSERIRLVLEDLVKCFSLPETEFRGFVKLALTPDIMNLIEVTPPRLPSVTLERFFAWDETLALLTAMRGFVHMKTRKRVIFNCGIGEGSQSFKDAQKFKAPPFNMITLSEVWDHF